MNLLDGSCVLNESVYDCIGAAFLHCPSDEREGEKVKGVRSAKAQGALAPTVAGEVNARRATNDEHQGVLGELSAQPPETGSVVAEKVPDVIPSALAWRDRLASARAGWNSLHRTHLRVWLYRAWCVVWLFA